MKRAQQCLLTFIACALLLSLESCSHGSKSPVTEQAERGGTASSSTSSTGPISGAASTPAPAQFYTPPGAVLDVKYTPNTVRIDFPTVKRTLRSVSEDGLLFVFDDTDPRLDQLQEGKVMLLEHIGVRRVLGALKQGSQVGVFTDEAALTDFIQDGRIEFAMPVSFQRAQAEMTPPEIGPAVLGTWHGWFTPPELVYAKEEKESAISVHLKGEVNNWEFELEGKPEGDGISLALDVAKKLAGLTASIKTKTDVEHISTAFKTVVAGAKVQDFEYSTPLTGKLHVTWAALTSGENQGIGEARLKLPPFAKQVVDIYGIPFMFRVDEALIFKPGFGTKHDAAGGGFEVEYDGTGGVSIHGEQSSPEGKMDGEETLEKTSSSSLAASGIVLAVNAPKVSLSLGTESIKESIEESIPGAILDKAAEAMEKLPFFKTLLKKVKEDFFKIEGAAYVQLVAEFDYTGSGPLSLVPCSMTHVNLLGQAGADAQFLAMKAEAPAVQLFKKAKTYRDPDVDACGPK